MIIGITGFKNSGKDTLGKILIDNYGYTKDSFAGPLKDAVSSIFGWSRELLEGLTPESRYWREQPDLFWEQKLDWQHHKGYNISKKFTPRFALQYIGTDVFRNNFCNNIWLYSLERRIYNKQNIVITDCRFTNELNLISKVGGILIKILRGNNPEWYTYAIDKNIEKLNEYGIHESEYSWINHKFDHVIYNNESIIHLKQEIDKIMNHYKE